MPPDQLVFMALALILAVLLVYFALTSIPAAVRPTLQPSTTSTVSQTP
jgi:cytoskeletal protein RodZ